MSIKPEDLDKETIESIERKGLIFSIQVIHKANLFLSDIGINAIPTTERKQFSDLRFGLQKLESILIDKL